MRILLCSLNEEILPDPVFPLGLAFLAGALTAAGHQYRVFDLCVDSLDNLAGLIEDFKPEIIALSLRNIDNVAYPETTTYLPHYKEVCRLLRQLTEAPLVLGGPGYSLFPERVLAELEADFGIVGSGEQPLISLLQVFEKNKDYGLVPNLLVRKDGAIIHNERLAQPLPDVLPRRQGFSLAAYFDLGGMANVQTKRGCPFECIYCSYPLIEGRVAKVRPVEEVIAELKDLAAAGFKEIYFVDSIFNNPPEYAKELCRAMIREDLSLSWTCYAAPFNFDQEMASLFKESGCLGLEFGTDSLSEEMLKALGKSFTVADVEQVSSLCREVDLPFCHAVLLGGPGETEITFWQTVERLAQLDPTAVIFMTGIRVIPGTPLYEIACREKLANSDTDMLEPLFYIADEIKPLLEKEINRLSRQHKKWIFPGHNIRCSEPLAKKMREKGARGPLWLNMATISNR